MIIIVFHQNKLTKLLLNATHCSFPEDLGVIKESRNLGSPRRARAVRKAQPAVLCGVPRGWARHGCGARPRGEAPAPLQALSPPGWCCCHRTGPPLWLEASSHGAGTAGAGAGLLEYPQQPSVCACERFPVLHLSQSFATRQMWPCACIWPRSASTTWAAPGWGRLRLRGSRRHRRRQCCGSAVSTVGAARHGVTKETKEDGEKVA